MIKKIKSFWNGLSSRKRKIVKTFIEAGLAYIGAYLATGALDWNSSAIMALMYPTIRATSTSKRSRRQVWPM